MHVIHAFHYMESKNKLIGPKQSMQLMNFNKDGINEFQQGWHHSAVRIKNINNVPKIKEVFDNVKTTIIKELNKAFCEAGKVLFTAFFWFFIM